MPEKEEKKTYELKVMCENCRHTWTEIVPFGHDVVISGSGQGLLVQGLEFPESLIECPNCGSSKVSKTWD